MKIIQYCQHVLGIGHLFRSLEICRALSDHEVILVTGGPQVDANLPVHVREVRLPDLQMNQEFKGLFSSQKNSTLEQVKTDRQNRLFALFEREKPDVFLPVCGTKQISMHKKKLKNTRKFFYRIMKVI